MTEDAVTLELPVRSIDVVDGSGGNRRRLRVFCPVESRSMDPRICARCDLCTSISEDLAAENAEVRCQIPKPSEATSSVSWFVGSNAVATWVPAGAVAGRALVCAMFDAPIDVVDEALERRSLSAALVIDEQRRVLGVVTRPELTARAGTPVLALAHSDILSIEESEPLARVIARFAYHRAHHVALTGAGGQASGLVSEVTLLHWIAARGASW